MSGAAGGGDGGGDVGGAHNIPPETPSIGEGSQGSTDAPRIGMEATDRPRPFEHPPSGNNDNNGPTRVERIEQLQVYDGPQHYEPPSDRPGAELLTTERAQYIAASFAIREGLIQEPGNHAPYYQNAEHAVADAFGTTREAGGPVDVIVPEPSAPGEHSYGKAGFEVKLSHGLMDAERGKRFEIGYAEYPVDTIESLPNGWDKDWDKEPMSAESQERARQIAERLYEAVKTREAKGVREKGGDPERITVIAFPYDTTAQEAQIFQFNRGDVFPDPSTLDWHFSKSGKGLEGIDRNTQETVINWNRKGGQIKAYISPQDAIKVSDIFPLKLPDGYGQTPEGWMRKIFPNLNQPTNRRQQ